MDFTRDVLPDSRGRIWCLSGTAIRRIDPRPSAKDKFMRTYPTGALPMALFESSDGKLWVAGRVLFAFDPEAPRPRDALTQVAPSLGGYYLGHMAEDSDHNLWVSGSGAMKVTRHGFTTYSKQDGLKDVVIVALSGDRRGTVSPITSDLEHQTIHQFNGSAFQAVNPRLPPGFQYAWGIRRSLFRTTLGIGGSPLIMA